MKRIEKLWNDSEETPLSILMDQVAAAEGEKLLEENERLQNNPSAAVPEQTDRICLKTIRRASVKKQWEMNAHFFQKYLGRAAVAVVAALALFTTAYASFPEVRLTTLNLLMKSSDVTSRLDLVFNTKSDAVQEREARKLMGYELPEMPQFFSVSAQNEDSMSGYIVYDDGNGASVIINITNVKSAFVDDEKADASGMVEIHGYQGLLVEKDENITVTWYDSEHESLIVILSNDVRKSFVISVAEGLIYSE